MKNYTLRETVIVAGRLIGCIWLLHVDIRLCLIIYLLHLEWVLPNGKPSEARSEPGATHSTPEQPASSQTPPQ